MIFLLTAKSKKTYKSICETVMKKAKMIVGIGTTVSLHSMGNKAVKILTGGNGAGRYMTWGE